MVAWRWQISLEVHAVTCLSPAVARNLPEIPSGHTYFLSSHNICSHVWDTSALTHIFWQNFTKLYFFLVTEACKVNQIIQCGQRRGKTMKAAFKSREWHSNGSQHKSQVHSCPEQIIRFVGIWSPAPLLCSITAY